MSITPSRTHYIYIRLLVVTNSILIVENDQENRYKVKINQREYVRYLKCTLYVFIPNSNESKEIENRETSFAAISDPSGWDDCPTNFSIMNRVRNKQKKRRTILALFFLPKQMSNNNQIAPCFVSCLIQKYKNT